MTDNSENTGGAPAGPKVPHHFESAGQHVESGKLGMWIFLSTEIMMFGGLFCGYAVYRAGHPEIFLYAHQFLDKTLGGINTIILICSSLTMAWAVRSAKLGLRKQIIWSLVLTMLFACGFMGIKAVEYEHKWKHGLLWGKKYEHVEDHGGEHGSKKNGAPGDAGAVDSAAADPGGEDAASGAAAKDQNKSAPATAQAQLPAATPTMMAMKPYDELIRMRSNLAPPGNAPDGLKDDATAHAVSHPDAPRNVHIFFGIYFVMTGLHGLHVLVGIGLILWITVCAARGHYDHGFFLPVENVGLYWHLVDLIWIYLFPLLYLIH